MIRSRSHSAIARNSVSPEPVLRHRQCSGKSSSRPRSPLHRIMVSASPEPVSDRRTVPGPPSVKGHGNRGDMSI
jgi:hypothetical protein